MSQARLSKSKLLAFRQCPKRLWLEVHRPHLKDPSAESAGLLQIGQCVGEIARSLFPDGKLIGHPDNMRAAIEATDRTLRKEPKRTLFEPAFRADGLLVRADVLLKPAGRAVMLEVKSTTRVKDYHLDDMAIQSHVLTAAGISLARSKLALLDKSWVYPGSNRYRGLFIEEDVTREIRPLTKDVPRWLGAARDVAASREPELEMGKHCEQPFACPFRAYCTRLAGPQPDYPLELLPGGNGKALARKLTEKGYEDLRDVPKKLIPAGQFRRIHRATIDATPILKRKARAMLAKLPYPRYYFDFETINLAVPIWSGTSPFQQIPFQWSCHIERTKSAELEHIAFLDLSGRDPSRACAEQLIDALGKRGPVIVYYAQFEKAVLKDLARRYPDLARPLNKIVKRIYDLLPVVQEHYYHPDMQGSYSIKAVLPTISRKMSYEHLGEVQDGQMAQAAFAEATATTTTPKRKKVLERALLKYCKQDTLAMVVVLEFLARRKERMRR